MHQPSEVKPPEKKATSIGYKVLDELLQAIHDEHEREALVGSYVVETTQKVFKIVYARSVRWVAPDMPQDKKIDRPPGTTLGRCLRFFLSEKFYERVVEPSIADAQDEYVKAVATGDLSKARWIKVRLWITVMTVLGVSPVSLALAIRDCLSTK